MVSLSDFKIKRTLSVPRLLAGYIKNTGVQFYNGSQKIDSQRVVSSEFLLPGIVVDAAKIWRDISIPIISLDSFDSVAEPFKTVFEAIKNRASGNQDDELMHLAKKDSFGSHWEIDSSSLLGVKVLVNPITFDTTSLLRLMCFTLAARRSLGLNQKARIDLNDVLSSWDNVPWEDLVLELNAKHDQEENKLEILANTNLPIYESYDFDPKTEFLSPAEKLNYVEQSIYKDDLKPTDNKTDNINEVQK